jgi:RNA polymerase sigma-70 factor (ECF subfamily)
MSPALVGPKGRIGSETMAAPLVRSEPEGETLELCRRGDVSAYRQIYDRYAGPLYRTAFRMLGRGQEAEDAVQETFLKLYRGIGGFKSGARFSTYLFRILINACLDAIRKRPPEGYSASSGLDSAIPLGSSSPETRYTIGQALDSLPPRMKASFVLYAVEGLSYEEIAGVLGVRIGSVKANIHRARARLKEWLGATADGAAP